MGHTQGPWTIGARYPESQWIDVISTTDERGLPFVSCKHHDQEDNARRIVAAVNGTSTLTVEALEAGVVDKLVDAASVAVEELDCIAEFAMRQTEWTGDDDAALLAVKNLRAALALARGEQA